MSFSRRVEKFGPIGVVVAIFALVVVFVNPLREGAMMDDWAYALSVRSLLQTGVNTPYIWFPTAFPAHTYWGGLFSLALGYSFAALRISTLALALGGLIALYFLAQEHGVGRWQAALLCVIFLGSPLVMQFSFNYMTDIPFTAWVTIALALATRGLRAQSFPLMVLAGLATAAATLTRFNGVALALGLALAWLLDGDRKARAGLYLAGLVPALAASAWMLNTILLQPQGDTGLSVSQQAGYLNQVGSLALNANWRVAAGLEYMALFALPMVLMAAVAIVSGLVRRSQDETAGGALPLPVVIGGLVYIAVTLAYGYFGLRQFVVMPLLQGDPSFFRRFIQPSEVFSITTALGAGLFAAIIAARYIPYAGAQKPDAHQRLIDLVTLFLLGSIAVLFQIIDRYVIVLLPYVLVVVGSYVSHQPGLRRVWIAAAGIAAVALVVSAAWTRWFLARDEAQWNAAEALVAGGVSPDDIATTWEWNSYHGAYEIYRAERKRPSATYGDYILKWLPKHLSEAGYFITLRKEDVTAEDWTVLSITSYDHWLFQERPIYVFKRKAGSAHTIDPNRSSSSDTRVLAAADARHPLLIGLISGGN